MESSYLVWVDIKGTNLTSTQVTSILASKAGVLVENGAHLHKKANVLEALERIEEIFKSL